MLSFGKTVSTFSMLKNKSKTSATQIEQLKNDFKNLQLKNESKAKQTNRAIVCSVQNTTKSGQFH
jgi:replication initiation and membrane attachment protein DnaB